jgi:DNA-binding FadR family transcriptional regulator
LPHGGEVVAVERAHAQILDAIAAGDDALARRRAGDHLATLTTWWM